MKSLLTKFHQSYQNSPAAEILVRSSSHGNFKIFPVKSLWMEYILIERYFSDFLENSSSQAISVFPCNLSACSPLIWLTFSMTYELYHPCEIHVL